MTDLMHFYTFTVMHCWTHVKGLFVISIHLFVLMVTARYYHAMYF